MWLSKNWYYGLKKSVGVFLDFKNWLGCLCKRRNVFCFSGGFHLQMELVLLKMFWIIWFCWKMHVRNRVLFFWRVSPSLRAFGTWQTCPCDDFWSNFACFGSKTYFLRKCPNDSAWFCVERVQTHFEIYKKYLSLNKILAWAQNLPKTFVNKYKKVFYVTCNFFLHTM